MATPSRSTRLLAVSTRKGPNSNCCAVTGTCQVPPTVLQFIYNWSSKSNVGRPIVVYKPCCSRLSGGVLPLPVMVVIHQTVRIGFHALGRFLQRFRRWLHHARRHRPRRRENFRIVHGHLIDQILPIPPQPF